MNIYTKTGDKGQTSLVTGTRVSKYHPRIEAYGTVDELNSWIGLICAQLSDENDKLMLLKIQDKLFTLGALLSQDETQMRYELPKIKQEDVDILEKEMDRMHVFLPKLNFFILPGGHTYVSYCHLARTVCRRAERLVCKLADETHVDEILVIYLNRLSDYLFVLSRKVAKDLNVDEIAWRETRD